MTLDNSMVTVSPFVDTISRTQFGPVILSNNIQLYVDIFLLLKAVQCAFLLRPPPHHAHNIYSRKETAIDKVVLFLLVDCVWNEWGEWQKCNVTCGDGWQKRIRTQQEEKYGGLPCIGNLDDWRPCNDRPCPGMKIVF